MPQQWGPPPVSTDDLLSQLDRATDLSLRDHPERQSWTSAGDGPEAGRIEAATAERTSTRPTLAVPSAPGVTSRRPSPTPGRCTSS